LVYSENDQGPSVITDGLKELRVNKAEQAVQVWAKESPLVGAKEIPDIVKKLTQAQNFFGNYKSYKTIKVEPINNGYQIIYLVLFYERGCLYMKCNYYTSEGRSYLQKLSIDEDPDKILTYRFYGSLKESNHSD
jgi:hypothetical protein